MLAQGNALGYGCAIKMIAALKGQGNHCPSRGDLFLGEHLTQGVALG